MQIDLSRPIDCESIVKKLVQLGVGYKEFMFHCDLSPPMAREMADGNVTKNPQFKTVRGICLLCEIHGLDPHDIYAEPQKEGLDFDKYLQSGHRSGQ